MCLKEFIALKSCMQTTVSINYYNFFFNIFVETMFLKIKKKKNRKGTYKRKQITVGNSFGFLFFKNYAY